MTTDDEHNARVGQTKGEFSVIQFFVGGSSEKGFHEYVRRNVSANEAMYAAKHYTSNVAARMGLIARVIIEDGDGYTCFEWVSGKGVTFPTEEDLKKS